MTDINKIKVTLARLQLELENIQKLYDTLNERGLLLKYCGYNFLPLQF
ncbi:SAM-dependent methyltransferase [Thermoanaerobacterium thermosaccharolyticum]|uniref:Uncharacterized protein n=2 Tax=Thermoanaerobacterium thermosaccharolyticum TaxID=1517 RepID=D9TML2_THETC|nr:hypothetical protein [Thermoanaerobacterium thermosaccharolyticum]ADL68500.1 hypothetical protein Tthe_0970 [Thermoanaerobacterium thermosaccharolyticum DSM 571]AST58585.1 SAM-dependent methyltransferase [Thermoanaerobacterium thermosaccharolyticum]